MFNSPFRPLTFGEILDGAFTLYRRHFLTFFVTALIPYVPIGITSGWFVGSTDPEANPLEFFGLFMLVMVVSVLAFVVMWSALTRQASQAYVGGEVALGDGFRTGLRSFFYVLVASIIAGLLMSMVMSVVMMIFVFAMAITLPLGGDSTGLTVAIAALMFLVTMVALIAAAAFCFAIVPAIVVERRNPFDAIGRSFGLAWGALPRVMGVVTVSYVIILLPLMGGWIALGLTQGFDQLLAQAGQTSPMTAAVQQLINTVVYSLTLPFMAASLVLLYYDRRARTEAHDLEGMVQGLAMAR